MIQIYRDFTLLSDWHTKNILSDYNIENLLQNEIRNTGTPEDNFLIFIKNNIKEVLGANPLIFERKIRKEINLILGNIFFTEKEKVQGKRGKQKKLNEDFISQLENIFNYNEFIKFDNLYNAYDLTERLNIKVCPYCNRNLISTLKPIKKGTKTIKSGTRPTLDHFYLKSEYPYLALSFWNLIPSCYSCNSQFRNTKSFSILTNIHPYLNSFEKLLYFVTDISDITEFIGNSQNKINIELKETKNTTKNSYKLSKAKKNSSIFRLQELYNQNHKEDVREIIQKTIIYGDTYSKSLFDNWKDIFVDEYDAQRMMLGNYTKKTDFEKRPLAKLTRDIAEELGLI